MAAKLIRYECVAPGHAADPAFPDKLTVNNGGWAFCPFDAHADGHSWRETAGEDLPSIVRRYGLSAVPTDGGERPGSPTMTGARARPKT